jgi:hypothetical protein
MLVSKSVSCLLLEEMRRIVSLLVTAVLAHYAFVDLFFY